MIGNREPGSGAVGLRGRPSYRRSLRLRSGQALRSAWKTATLRMTPRSGGQTALLPGTWL